ncbi:hypothetical protein BY458DRAFT_531002 [Sporodiniella umbellata]|nr:hypothetical protein BY458DRAFT_531002 [Sporodiniella umbellata]
MTVETAAPTIIDHNNAEPTAQIPEKKGKKPIRQAVGGIVIMDNKVLMLSSRKSDNALRLPRGDCRDDELPEKAVLRVLRDEAGIETDHIKQRVGTYTKANKKGKIVYNRAQNT